MNLNKLAAVFDAMANYVEVVEREKSAHVENTRKARIDKIAAAHVSAHGEELSDEARQKLARVDENALDYIDELLTKQGGVIEPMGAGVTPDADDQPKTVKQAADAASDQFLSWIVS